MTLCVLKGLKEIGSVYCQDIWDVFMLEREKLLTGFVESPSPESSLSANKCEFTLQASSQPWLMDKTLPVPPSPRCHSLEEAGIVSLSLYK